MVPQTRLVPYPKDVVMKPMTVADYACYIGACECSSPLCTCGHPRDWHPSTIQGQPCTGRMCICGSYLRVLDETVTDGPTVTTTTESRDYVYVREPLEPTDKETSNVCVCGHLYLEHVWPSFIDGEPCVSCQCPRYAQRVIPSASTSTKEPSVGTQH
jgi:hypothetical protein